MLFSILIALSSLSCSENNAADYIASAKIIPAPTETIIGEGYFEMPEDVVIQTSRLFADTSFLLLDYLKPITNIGMIATRNSPKPNFFFEKDNSINNEGYVLEISEKKVVIKSNSSSGAFYGVQTFLQLLPADLEAAKKSGIEKFKIPTITIKDAPQFSYRGMHLDVSRHFFPVDFIKEYIDHLAMLKMNTFHWHLTDDQGWRIEIKQYPDLTNKGAYREETLIGHYNDTPQQFDGKRYGGFYTHEEVKEIVAYAADRHVTVIPEIELPGHAQAAVHAYPELGCTGEQVPVATKWGVFENIYCPKPETFTFLKNVLDEVMPLFPGEYIHIGGDEAPKKQWKACGHCQKLISEKGLKDEHGLQSYFIKQIEAHVNSKGKKIIGWDEILEGGLAPNATVMSWRGTQGAVDAANEGHDVILTPTSHAYFDYYQATHEDEPTAIGGYLPLKKVYGFNPIPKKLQGTEAAKHVLGAQGNIWTEYLATEDQVEYMAFPRMLAMAEVVWSGPTLNLEDDYTEFLTRVEPFMERLDVLEVNNANHLNDIMGKVSNQNGVISYTLETASLNKQIRYSLNGTEEKIYDGPIKIVESSELAAQVFKNNENAGRLFIENIVMHKGINATVSINVAPHPSYSAGGKEALINGVNGSDTRFGDKEWLGFWGDDLWIDIKFSEPTEISKVSTRFYDANGQWVYAPKEIFIIGRQHREDIVFKPNLIESIEDENLITKVLNLPVNEKIIVDGISLKIPSYGIIPDGLQGAGHKAWTFIDEIVIE